MDTVTRPEQAFRKSIYALPAPHRRDAFWRRAIALHEAREALAAAGARYDRPYLVHYVPVKITVEHRVIVAIWYEIESFAIPDGTHDLFITSHWYQNHANEYDAAHAAAEAIAKASCR